ncbi:hypothetical protein EIP75_16120 [Aquabacterium soli]|uniref:Uncharacterized protein n=1 Tax=Aquabacterium soli TaxID=2493092 RepID=A0A426V8F1_9BURK|nr:hypothetical protein [Aquabacterium soli]RRS03217.1 hypothetical protein EIP75_16120 [Aquabacterium soli]
MTTKTIRIKAARPATQLAHVPSVRAAGDKANTEPYAPFIRQRRDIVYSHWHPLQVEVAQPSGLGQRDGERWADVLQWQALRAVGVEYAGHFIQERRTGEYRPWLWQVVESMIQGGSIGPTERAFLGVLESLAMEAAEGFDLWRLIEERRQAEISSARDWLNQRQQG